MALIVHGVKSKEPKGKSELKKIRACAASRGIHLVELLTERPEHCESLVRDADLIAVDVVAVMGGDGTLREGVSGMAARPEPDRRPIIVFPCGTGNNFARDLGHKTIDDVFAAVDAAVAHPMDAVKVTHPEACTTPSTASRGAWRATPRRRPRGGDGWDLCDTTSPGSITSC